VPNRRDARSYPGRIWAANFIAGAAPPQKELAQRICRTYMGASHQRNRRLARDVDRRLIAVRGTLAAILTPSCRRCFFSS
jgi:hypothetical protein